MIAAVALASLAVVVAGIAARTLPAAAWARRAPRLGVLVGQSATLCMLASMVLAGLALAVPILPVATSDLAGLLGACEFLLREHYETPGGILIGLTGAAAALAMIARLTHSLATEGRTVRRERRRQRDGIALVGRPDVVPGAWVVEDSRPALFCIPGIRSQVVLTTGAVAALTPQQRNLALAHEHAHLSGHHHLALTFTAAVRRAFPFVRLFAVAATEIGTLVEMHADDRAAGVSDRHELAAALVRLAGGPRPAGAIAANGGAALQRVQRLMTDSPGLPAVRRWWISATAAALVVTPLLIAVAPALESALLDYCAVALHT